MARRFEKAAVNVPANADLPREVLGSEGAAFRARLDELIRYALHKQRERRQVIIDVRG